MLIVQDAALASNAGRHPIYVREIRCFETPVPLVHPRCIVPLELADLSSRDRRPTSICPPEGKLTREGYCELGASAGAAILPHQKLRGSARQILSGYTSQGKGQLQ